MVSAKGVNSMIKPLHKFVLIKKEEKRKNSQWGIFKKRKFPARFTGEKDPPGKTGDWGKKVRMGTTAGCGIWGRGNS